MSEIPNGGWYQTSSELDTVVITYRIKLVFKQKRRKLNLQPFSIIQRPLIHFKLNAAYHIKKIRPLWKPKMQSG